MSKNPIYEVSIGGDEAPYAEYHQKGTKKMPQRKILPSDNESFKSDVHNGIISTAKLAIENTVTKINKSKTLGLKDFLKEVNKHMDKAMPPIIKGQIRRLLKDGMSPVKGKRAFKKYSDSYEKDILAGRYNKYSKKVSPVNLRLSGELYRSLEVKKKQ